MKNLKCPCIKIYFIQYSLLLIGLLIFNRSSLLSQNALTELQIGSNVNYELAERFSGKKISQMIYSREVIPYWFSNSDKFWYIYKDSKQTKYYIVDPAKKEKKELFNNSEMAAKLSEIVGDPYDESNLPIGRFSLRGDTSFVFEIISSLSNAIDPKSGKYISGVKVHGFEYNIENKVLKEIDNYKSAMFYPVWGSISPDRKHIVFSKNFNLYYMSWADYEKAMINPADTSVNEIQITFDGSPSYSYGPDLMDYQKIESEKHIRRRPEIAWTKDSKHFVLIRTDYSNVKDLWIINSLSGSRPQLEQYKYQMPGEKEAPSRFLYIFSKDDNYKYKTVNVARFKDQNITLHIKPKSDREKFSDYKIDYLEGNDSIFYVNIISRDHKRIDLCAININNDEVETIIEERSNKYLETRPTIFLDNRIIWWSQRDGWGHLYLYNLNKIGKGNSIKESPNFLSNRLTSGSFHVEGVAAIDTVKSAILIYTNGIDKNINPYYTHICRVYLDGTGFKVLNPGNYNNNTYVLDNGKYFVNNYSRVDTIPASNLYDASGNIIMKLEEADFAELFAAGYKFPEPFTVKSADGKTDLYGVMYKPFDFDSTKKYPIIQYVYPGPHMEAVNYSWSSEMTDTDRMAQLGFIVVTIGNRGGHPSRSKWYHTYGYGNLRDYGIEDKKRAVEILAAKHPYIDISRVGIYGHSGGGFMTATAMLRYPDFFKVGISMSGNHDNRIYNRWWGEQHNGVSEVINGKDTVFKFNVKTNIELASNLKGRLLLITGDIDNNVHPANTFRLADALIKAKKRFDMFIIPGQRHSLTPVKEYLFWIKADYFIKHLLWYKQENIDIIQISNN